MTNRSHADFAPANNARQQQEHSISDAYRLSCLPLIERARMSCASGFGLITLCFATPRRPRRVIGVPRGPCFQ